MIRDLWRRKISFGRSKGISTVIATVFLVIVVFSILANVFIWTISQNNLYSQSVRESHELDADRFSERIIAYGGNYSVWGDKVEVRGILANEGPVSAQILTLWVLDGTNKQYNITDLRERNYNLNPGDTLPITTEVTIPGASSSHTFTSWFVTARGNTVPLEEEEQYATISNVTRIVISNLTKVMGPVFMDFKSLRWHSHQSGHDGTWWINKSETKLEWFATITNFGDQNLTLKYESAFAIYSVELGGEAKELRRWFIREEYLVPVGETVELGFCWTWPNSGAYDSGELKFLGTSATFLLLIGQWDDGTHFGENLPYQAIWVD